MAARKVDLRSSAGLFHAGLRLHATLDLGCHGDERLRSRVNVNTMALEKRLFKGDALTCSTLVEFFAEVSKNGISRESANSCTLSMMIFVKIICDESSCTFAVVYSTTFFEVKSHLLPTSILFTLSLKQV